MKINRFLSIIALVVLGGIANAGEQKPPVTAEAWRTSLDAFGKEVVAIAGKSEMPDAAVQIKRIREYSVLSNAKGEDVWVIFKQGFGNEFHGKLAERFSGAVSWSGVVDSVQTDANAGIHIVNIKFPVPAGLPKGLEFANNIRLTIPISKLPAEKLPAKGSEFAFQGNLKKEKEKDPAPLLVFYGLGPNAGTEVVKVNLVDVEPLDSRISKSAVSEVR